MIGKSDEAVDEALYLARFARTVHFFAPSKEINVDEDALESLKGTANIVMHLGSVVKEINGTEKVEGVRFLDREAGDNERDIPVEGGLFIYRAANRSQISCRDNSRSQSKGVCRLTAKTKPISPRVCNWGL